MPERVFQLPDLGEGLEEAVVSAGSSPRATRSSSISPSSRSRRPRRRSRCRRRSPARSRSSTSAPGDARRRRAARDVRGGGIGRRGGRRDHPGCAQAREGPRGGSVRRCRFWAGWADHAADVERLATPRNRGWRAIDHRSAVADEAGDRRPPDGGRRDPAGDDLPNRGLHGARGRSSGPRRFALPLFARALAEVCREHPELNASWDGERILLFHEIRVGIATDTERGLMVPVLADVGSLGINEIAAEIARLAEAARSNMLSRDDVVGATIAVTNTGSYGSEFGTPLLNPGHAVTIALGVIEPRALVVDGVVEARPACTLVDVRPSRARRGDRRPGLGRAGRAPRVARASRPCPLTGSVSSGS